MPVCVCFTECSSGDCNMWFAEITVDSRTECLAKRGERKSTANWRRQIRPIDGLRKLRKVAEGCQLPARMEGGWKSRKRPYKPKREPSGGCQ
jgi:hypothetical protein